jgi:hypothetical protein
MVLLQVIHDDYDDDDDDNNDKVVRTVNDDIHMESGCDKCEETVIKKGKSVHSQNLILDFNREIQQLKQGKTYKYLGIEESEGIQH